MADHYNQTCREKNFKPEQESKQNKRGEMRIYNRFRCIWCNNIFQDNITYMKQHITKCKTAPEMEKAAAAASLARGSHPNASLKRTFSQASEAGPSSSADNLDPTASTSSQNPPGGLEWGTDSRGRAIRYSPRLQRSQVVDELLEVGGHAVRAGPLFHDDQHPEHHPGYSNQRSRKLLGIPLPTISEEKQIEHAVALFLHGSGRAFSYPDDPLFRNMVCKLRPGFHLKGSDFCGGKMIDEIDDKINGPNGLMEQQLKRAKVLTASADDSEDMRNLGLTNVIMLSPTPCLVGAIRKDEVKRGGGEATAAKILPHMEAREQKVAAFMSDTENKMKACQTSLATSWKGKESSIFRMLLTLLCLAHCYNLFLKDLFTRLKFFSDHAEDMKDLIKFWTNIQVARNLFISVQGKLRLEAADKHKKDASTPLVTYSDLQKVVETRFNSHVDSMQSGVSNRDVFVSATAHPDWRNEVMGTTDSDFKARATGVKDDVNDDDFWDQKAMIVELLKPICTFIDFLQSDAPCLSKVYSRHKELAGHIETTLSSPAFTNIKTKNKKTLSQKEPVVHTREKVK